MTIIIRYEWHNLIKRVTMRMERRGNGFANIIKREICLGQLAYNGRRQISSQYVNLLHTCKHPKIRGYWNRQNHNWFKKFFSSSNVKSFFWRNFFSHLLFCQQMWHFFSSKVALVFSAFYREKVLPFWPKINGHLSAHGAHSLSTKQKDRRNILWGNFIFIQ